HTSRRSAPQLVLGYGPAALRELTDITGGMIQRQQQERAHPAVWPSALMMAGTDEEGAAEAFPGQLRQDGPPRHDTGSERSPQRVTAGSLDERSLRIAASAMLDWLIEAAPNLTIRLAEPVIDADFSDGLWQVRTPQGKYAASV